MEKVDIAIIGAGVIGLAIARELSKQHSYKTIVVIEKRPKYGQETSSRNSEVIHSGIYYPANMLKTSLCIEGNSLLYEYCQKHRVAHYPIGKLIIASHHDASGLEHLQEQAKLNDIRVEVLSQRKIQIEEPAIAAELGLFIKNTGIINSHDYLSSLYFLGNQNGVHYLFNSGLRDIQYDGKSYIIETPAEKIKAEIVINAAGLFSDQIPAMLGIDIDRAGYRLHPCKGEYFKINRRININHLVYPIPDHYGLGIHLTKDINGSLRLGPNAYYVDEIDYSITEARKQEFYHAAQRYLPFLDINDLTPDFTGIRPKLQASGEVQTKDFLIREERDKGLPGLINLIGIESPGLTSSLSIARYVNSILH
ncbi:MAG: NAD(P)/FAD-dependent oxidoreductase [Firmicutes bacterium HGW-Firmicutes-15]|nr:MAG: NAD(P)/FAD-dependent oxidoreductase [Firmicutes bacterium HGW-Firmicutes-15]